MNIYLSSVIVTNAFVRLADDLTSQVVIHYLFTIFIKVISFLFWLLKDRAGCKPVDALVCCSPIHRILEVQLGRIYHEETGFISLHISIFTLGPFGNLPFQITCISVVIDMRIGIQIFDDGIDGIDIVAV